jgi:hypothetical protein
MGFKDKVVVITGASSGIGRALAEEFASRGANIVIGARQYVTLCEITADLESKYGIKAVAIQADVSKEQDCELLIKQAIITFGKIDILINNAGLSMRALFKDVDLIGAQKPHGCEFLGYCILYQICAARNIENLVEACSWHLINCWISWLAWTHGLFLIKICHEWIYGVAAYRIIENKCSRYGSLSGFYHVEYSGSCIGKRWLGTWRNQHGRRKNDERPKKSRC